MGHCIYISFPLKSMVSPLARMCLWVCNDGVFSNIFHIEKGYILKKYNPIKAAGWDGLHMYVFIPPIIYDLVVFTAWESDSLRHFSKIVALFNWYSQTNASVETETEQDCGTDLHVEILISFKFLHETSSLSVMIELAPVEISISESILRR